MSKNFGTFTTAPHKPVTLEDIAKVQEAFIEHGKQIEQSIHEELAKWMREQGFDPDKRCFLCMPMTRAQDLPSWPAFVRFSPLIASPILIRDTVDLL